MCGLYGYIGKLNAIQEVYNGLKRLQYRGYDSCGIAYLNKSNRYVIRKKVGQISRLSITGKSSNTAFGHTRWATTGKVSKINAHPHISFDKRVVLVHNGIITNYLEIKNKLIDMGYKFYSQTDSEVIANYISSLANIENDIHKIFNDLDGSFALIVGIEDKIYLIKKSSPLNILKNKDGIYISSDISSLPSGKLYSMQDLDIIKIQKNKIAKINGDKIDFSPYKDNLHEVSKQGQRHYMIKEVLETPKALERTYENIKKIDFKAIFSNIKKIVMLGCGTAHNSCLIGKYYFDKLNKFETDCYLASNYKMFCDIPKNQLHIIVSQSGETADCIEVAKQIKQHDGLVMLITNQENSSLSQYADYVVNIKANKEISVASTKTYSCQLLVFIYIYSVLLNSPLTRFGNNILRLKEYINSLDLIKISKVIKKVKNLILIGMDLDYLTIIEASLKIREIDYIFTLPILASELKHGTLALIDKHSVVLSLQSSKIYDFKETKQEIESRRGRLINISLNGLEIDERLKPIFAIVPFQIISYQVAVLKGIDPDMPRNLAKSVTVK